MVTFYTGQFGTVEGNVKLDWGDVVITGISG